MMRISPAHISNIWRAAWKVLAVVSGLTAIFSLFYLFVEFVKLDDPIAQRILAVSIPAFVCLLLLGFFLREIQVARKERYANITDNLHSIFHRLRDVCYYLTEFHNGDLPDESPEMALLKTEASLSKVLDDIGGTFSILTGTQCRASIKTFDEINGQQYMFTLTRDNKSRQRYFEIDKKRADILNDPINLNHHDQLHKLTTASYINNDLPGTDGFMSTSLRAYQGEFVESDVTPSNFEDCVWANRRNKKWPLPYCSTLVCAIRHKQSPDFEIPSAGIMGVLGVDSNSRGVFIEKYDLDLALAFADALMVPLFLRSRIGDSVE